MKQLTVNVHEIAVDGLPAATPLLNLAPHLQGRVAFIYKDRVMSGSPVRRECYPELYRTVSGDETLWASDALLGTRRLFSGVTHWIELPCAATLAQPPEPAPRTLSFTLHPPVATVTRAADAIAV